MSFSSDTKNELARLELNRKCCVLAEIAGFVRVCGTLKLSGGGKIDLKLATENPAVARMYLKKIKSSIKMKNKCGEDSSVKVLNDLKDSKFSLMFQFQAKLFDLFLSRLYKYLILKKIL